MFTFNLQPMPNNQPVYKSIAESFLQLVSTNRVREAFNSYIKNDFRHHNVFFKGDAVSLRGGMEENAVLFPFKKLEVKQLIMEDNLVVAHSLVKMEPGDTGIALIHIFRFEDGKIAELWDLSQPIPAGSINENGPF